MTRTRRRWAAVLVPAIFGALLTLPTAPALAADAAVLDPRFGTDGVLHVGPAEAESHAYDVAVTPSGRFLVVGASDLEPLILGLDRHGRPDPSFGVDGRAGVPGSDPSGSLLDVAATPDGGAVAVGPVWRDGSPGTRPSAVVVRYTAEGEPDPAFGVAGVVELDPVPDRLSFPYSALAMLPGGDIVVAYGTEDGRTRMVRLDPAGQEILRYGDDGVVCGCSFGTYFDGAPLVVAPDGRVAFLTADDEIRAFLPDGTPDLAFDGDGVLAFDHYAYLGRALGVDDSGRLLLATAAQGSSVGVDLRVRRLSRDGSLDPTFGAGGTSQLSVTPPGSPARRALPVDMLVQDDGGIVVVGEVSGWGMAARLLPDGSPDPDFGPGGVLSTEQLTDGVAAAFSGVAQAPTGELVAVGWTSCPCMSWPSSMVAVRFLLPPQPVQLAPACSTSKTSASFDDTVGNTHEAAVACAAWWGLVRGVTEDLYAPDRPVTRAQAASLLDRLLSATGHPLPAATADAFTDDEGNPHEAAIDRLAAAGLVQGRTPTVYSPSEPVSRAQLASLLLRVLAHTGLPPLSDAPDAFDDDGGSVHEANLDRVALWGLLAGTGPRTASPNRSVPRDQAATYLARALSLMVLEGLTPAPA